MLRSFIAALLLSGLAHASCFTVSASGSGTNSGADWSNTLNGATLASNVVRGNIYYLAGGSYGHPSFSKANSGTSTITIKAATVADHGTASGCGATGWSDGMAATGANRVSFRNTTNSPNTFNGAVAVSTDYWIFDGNGGWANSVNTNSSNYNMTVDISWPAPEVGIDARGTDNSTFKYIYFPSFGLDIESPDSKSIATISCASNVATVTLTGQRQHAYLYVGQWITISGVTNAGFNSAGSAANGTQIASVTSGTDWTQAFTVSGDGYTCPNGASDTTGTVAGPATTSDEMINMSTAGQTNNTVQYSLFTNDCNSFILRQGSNFTVDHSAFLRNTGNATAFHCEVISDSGSTGLTFSNNIALDLEGTATLVVLGGSVQRTVSTASWSAGTATVTLTAGGSDYTVGGTNGFIGISGIAPSGYNTVAAVTAVSGNQVSYALVSDPGTYSSGGITYVAWDADSWSIYNNIFGFTLNNPYARGGAGDGIINCINMQRCTNWNVYHNTFVGGNFTNPGAWGFSTINGSLCSGNVFENNLIWNVAAASGKWSNTCATTEDYNSYLNLGAFAPTSTGAHDTVANSLPNPFTNEAGYVYTLAGETVNYTGGLTLANPFAIDVAGATRGADGTWERGAFEFNSGNAPATAPALGMFALREVRWPRNR